MKKIIAILLTAIVAVSGLFVGCGETTASEPQRPDYSDSDKRFEFFAYQPPTNGKWYVDGVEYSAYEDFRTAERYKEYKDCGLDILMLSGTAEINGSETSQKNALAIMDEAYKGGVDKILLKDARIYNLLYSTSAAEREKQLKYLEEISEEDLDAFISSCLAAYKDHPAFYGVMILDEPSYVLAKAYGKLYKSIKRVMPECHVYYNFLPMMASVMAAYPELETVEGAETELSEEEELFARYEKYINLFIDEMGCDSIQYDDYPMNDGEISEYFIPCLQICAKVAKERGIDLCVTTQTFNMTVAGTKAKRNLSQADAVYLNNILLGYGVKQISYFTYFTKSDNSTSGETFIDGQSFIKRNGEKTDLYYIMQDIMAQNQKFAPYILNFDYNASKTYVVLPTNYRAPQINYVKDDGTFTALSDCVINKECALVTELVDEEKGNYMYMAMNLTDPLYKGSKAYQTITLTFDAKYTWAMIYKDGEFTYQQLNEQNAVEIKAAAGEASFVIPY